MSDKKPTSELLAWFEAGLGLVAEQVAQTNQTIQQTLKGSHQTLNEFANRGEAVEAQLRKMVDPKQWIEVWRMSPFHHWMPDATTQKQKRAAQLDLLSAKVDILVEQVALLAAKQAADKTEQLSRSTTRKPANAAATAKSTTTRKRTTRKPAVSRAKNTPPETD